MFGRFAGARTGDSSSATSERSEATLTPQRTSGTSPRGDESVGALIARCSNILVDALGEDADGLAFSKVNEGRRLIERVRELALSGEVEAREALDSLEELANEAVERLSRGAFADAMVTPTGRREESEATMTSKSGGLDLFSGLTLNDSAPRAEMEARNLTLGSMTLISPHVLFGGDESTPDSSWRPDVAGDVFGDGKENVADIEFDRLFQGASEAMESPPVFDEVIDEGTFEFAVAMQAEPDLTPSAVDLAQDRDADELTRLLKASDVRLKPAKLAYDSALARGSAATSRRKHCADEAFELLGKIEDLKRAQEVAVANDDYEQAQRLEETIEGARTSFKEIEEKLFAAEQECASTIDEAAAALKTWLAASRSTIDEVASFADSKRLELDKKTSARDREARDAAEQRVARRAALEVSVLSSSETMSALKSKAEELARVKESLLPPTQALRDEIESMRAALAQKEAELETKEAELAAKSAEWEDLSKQIERAFTTVDAARTELERWDEEDTNEDTVEARAKDAHELALEKVLVETEAKMTHLRDNVAAMSQKLLNCEQALDSMYIERETVARERAAQAALDLQRVKDEVRSAEAASEREAALTARISELERAKSLAVVEKRFLDAQCASTEMKTIQNEIDVSRSSSGVDPSALERAEALAVETARVARAARLTRLRAECDASTDDTDPRAIAARRAIELLLRGREDGDDKDESNYARRSESDDS